MAATGEDAKEQIDVKVDSSVYQPKKKVKGESYETLRYSFKPSSVKNQPGVLWKQKERVDDPVGTKVFVEFKGDESKVEASSGGKSPVLAAPLAHIFEGTMQAGSEHDCLLIVDSSGNARLELLSASAQLKKITSGTVPSVRPGSTPGHIGTAGGGAAASPPAVSSDADSSDSDESDSSSQARPSPVITAAVPPAGGGGKGLMSSGGKGLLSAGTGGKGLMTLQQAQSHTQQSSSSSDGNPPAPPLRFPCPASPSALCSLQ